jgi:hypothetical protein
MASPTLSARIRILFRSLRRITQFWLTPKHTYNLIDNTATKLRVFDVRKEHYFR